MVNLGICTAVPISTFSNERYRKCCRCTLQVLINSSSIHFAVISGATEVNACAATESKMGGSRIVYTYVPPLHVEPRLTVYEDFLHEAQFHHPLARARLEYPRQRCQHLFLLVLPPKARKVILVPRAAAAASSPRPCPRPCPFLPPAPQRDLSYSLALPVADTAAVPAYTHRSTT